MKVSINRLADLTGLDRRTVSRRLKSLTPDTEGRAHLYESTEALPLLYGVHSPGEALDLSQERAHLAREQRLVTELKRKQLEGEVIPASVVVRAWQGIFVNIRARLLHLPSRIAPIVAPLTAPPACAAAAEVVIYEALEELAETVVYSEPAE